MANTMKAVWQGGRLFAHTAASGHTLVTDTPEEAGGTDSAVTPMELILLGVIGCTGVDVVSILEKMREPIEGLEIEAGFERSEKHPRIYTRIHIAYSLRGDLEEKNVQRAIELSQDRYCSASATVAATAKMTYEFVIVKD